MQMNYLNIIFKDIREKQKNHVFLYVMTWLHSEAYFKNC